MNTALLFAIWLSTAEPVVAAGITMYQDAPTSQETDDLGNPVVASRSVADVVEAAEEQASGPSKGVRLGLTLLIAAALFFLWAVAAR